MTYKLKWNELDLSDDIQVEIYIYERAMTSMETGQVICADVCIDYIVEAYQRGWEDGLETDNKS